MENRTKRLLTQMLKITFGSREKAGNCCLKTATKFQFSVKHRLTFLKHLKYKERYTTLLNVLSVVCMCNSTDYVCKKKTIVENSICYVQNG